MRKSILLVDEHALLLNGIKNWIENHSDYKVEFQASNVEDCKKIQNQFEKGRLKADEFLAVVDISFKTVDSQMENSGFDIIKEFFGLSIPCIAYSSHDSGGFVEHATSPAVGAKGFVSKTADESILLAAINSVANGGTYILAELVTGLQEVRDITHTFTKKEKLVADTLTIHNTNAEVAATLFNPAMTLLRCAMSGSEILLYDFLYGICGILIIIASWAFWRTLRGGISRFLQGLR